MMKTTATQQWTQAEAIQLCQAIELIAPRFGAHVALTGGTLYKNGARKDCDILFYRIRQAPKIKVEELFNALELIGLVKLSGFGWCYKAIFQGKHVDCFFPEEGDGEYISDSQPEIVRE